MSDAECVKAPPARLQIDYLVIGAGAMGMAFADEIHRAQPKARIALVDRRAQPGGHWNDAYPFVALHQPAAFYGLNSANLGTGGADLATGAEIVAYYRRAMQRMLASGRVHFFSQSECRQVNDGAAQIVSLLDEQRVSDVEVTTRVVDASYMKVAVPSTHNPGFDVAEEVALIPPNALPSVRKPWQRYVVIGAGKTAIDAILYLLDRGVAPDRVRWITPNDAWLWNRASMQPGLATAELLVQLQTVIEHRHADAIFPALETRGSVLRVDRDLMPVKWRCATVDPAEVAALRRVKDVVRLGRVQSIGNDAIQLAQGSIRTDGASLHINCTADGLAKRPSHPVFETGRITLQSIFMCQQVFSAAAIGRLAASKRSDAELNRLCRVVPHPEFKQDLATCLTASVQNLLTLNRSVPLWVRRSRLSLMHHDSLWQHATNAITARRILPKALALVEEQAGAASS